MNHEFFDSISFFISALVVCLVCAEFFGIVLGLINPNELLIVCTVGGVATLLAFRLSRMALTIEH